MTPLHVDTREALSEGGALSEAIEGFLPREAQQRLANAIVDALDATGALLAEAGTGTGKTFAYLVPALLSGKKTIISTGTRALQDQLYHRDLPRVRKALGATGKSALLKGRANYLCRYRMEQAKGEARLTSKEAVAQFQRVMAWSGRTRFGDLSEIEGLPEDASVIPVVTSTNENCLGNECPFWGECFVVQARQRAQAADLVVVNHHLLLADLALKQEGFGEILPGAQLFVVDEAHALPDLAAQFFGEGIGARLLVELARDTLSESRGVPAALAALQAPAQQLEHVTRHLRAAFDVLPVRGTRALAMQEPAVAEAMDAVADALQNLIEAVAPWRESASGVDAVHARAIEARARLMRWLDAWNNDDPDEADNDDAQDNVYWYELTARGFRLQRTPLDVAGPLRQHRERSRAAWVFTSATLAVEGAFQHVGRKLGLWEPETLLEPGPFDWPTQALCYLPTGLPEPNTRSYTQAVLDAVQPVLEASRGRAFLLFASHRALKEAAESLRAARVPWPLFVQNEAPRAQLLDAFRASGNGVLLGTASFREGVDVAGDALSVVVIDKLPFAAPDDPVFEARLDAVRRRGGNPFRDEQLPQAAIALKQGAGRLIRTESDRGVLVLCDPRILGKPYGKVFRESLPPLPYTRDLADVQAFFAARDTARDDEAASSG